MRARRERNRLPNWFPAQATCVLSLDPMTSSRRNSCHIRQEIGEPRVIVELERHFGDEDRSRFELCDGKLFCILFSCEQRPSTQVLGFGCQTFVVLSPIAVMVAIEDRLNDSDSS